MRNELVMAPGGWRPRSQVHLVPAGATIATGRHLAVPVKHYAKPGAPDDANWITSGYWNNRSGGSITAMAATWLVPRPPAAQADQLLYLFPGMEPVDGTTIVQPVLQWGDSGPDEDGVNRTGPFWTIASWIVPAPDGQTYHTPHLRVWEGETLRGTITLAGRSEQGFSYRCAFTERPGTDFVTPPIPELTWCMATLEAYESGHVGPAPYDLRSSLEYPDTPGTTFRAIDITTTAGPGPAGAWMPWDIVDNWGEQTAIGVNASTGGEVNIRYRAPSARRAGPAS